jgi:hypothetical protein
MEPNMIYPDAKTLRQLLDYNPDTGAFIWRARPESMFSSSRQTAAHNCNIWNARFAGKSAGCVNQGYHKIRVNDVLYLAHILAWIMVYDAVPSGDLDHVNMDPSDNRIQNLREAPRSQNMGNTRAHKDSFTGRKGVYFDKKGACFVARVCKDGVCKYLGRFAQLDDAASAYTSAAQDAFGEFARVL